MDTIWAIGCLVTVGVIVWVSLDKYFKKLLNPQLRDAVVVTFSCFLGLVLTKTFEGDSSTNLLYHEPKFHVTNYHQGFDDTFINLGFNVQNLALLEAYNIQYITVYEEQVLFMPSISKLRQGSEITLWSFGKIPDDYSSTEYSTVFYLMYEVGEGKRKKAYFQRFNFFSLKAPPEYFELNPGSITYSKEIESYDSLYYRVLREHKPFSKPEGSIIIPKFPADIGGGEDTFIFLSGSGKALYYDPKDSLVNFLNIVGQDTILLQDQIMPDRESHSIIIKWDSIIGKIAVDGKPFLEDIALREEIKYRETSIFYNK